MFGVYDLDGVRPRIEGPHGVRSRTSTALGRAVVKLLLLLGTVWTLGCSSRAQTPADGRSPRTQQQVIVDRATAAVVRIREQPRFGAMEALLAEARAVLVFPKLIKASFMFGGEGGNGVLLVRTDDGSWSVPAFYSLGAPSIGLQAGFRESTAILFIMNELTLQAVLHSSLTLGAETSATLGHVGERGLAEGEILSKDIYVLTEAGGAFAGFSLDGYIITSRGDHDELYYGVRADPRDILIDGKLAHSGATALRAALGTERKTRTEPETPVDYRTCSPESRQAASCRPEQVRVCAKISVEVTPAWRTFENACEACRAVDVDGYRPGACTTSD